MAQWIWVLPTKAEFDLWDLHGRGKDPIPTSSSLTCPHVCATVPHTYTYMITYTKKQNHKNLNKTKPKPSLQVSQNYRKDRSSSLPVI